MSLYNEPKKNVITITFSEQSDLKVALSVISHRTYQIKSLTMSRLTAAMIQSEILPSKPNSIPNPFFNDASFNGHEIIINESLNYRMIEVEYILSEHNDYVETYHNAIIGEVKSFSSVSVLDPELLHSNIEVLYTTPSMYARLKSSFEKYDGTVTDFLNSFVSVPDRDSIKKVSYKPQDDFIIFVNPDYSLNGDNQVIKKCSYSELFTKELSDMNG